MAPCWDQRKYKRYSHASPVHQTFVFWPVLITSILLYVRIFFFKRYFKLFLYFQYFVLLIVQFGTTEWNTSSSFIGLMQQHSCHIHKRLRTKVPWWCSKVVHLHCLPWPMYSFRCRLMHERFILYSSTINWRIPRFTIIQVHINRIVFESLAGSSKW